MSDETQRELVENEAREIATRDVEPPENPTDRMIWLAIQRDADIDKLERLITLKNREEERDAKRRFEENFAAMQNEFTAVSRSKSGYDYDYAPLEKIQEHYNPVIAKYGFSYRWREETIEGGKRCTIIISGHGHAEENSFDIPKIQGTSRMNAIQVAGAMSTYGRRYTFIAGFGVIIADEDTDAGEIPGEKVSQYLEDITRIREAETLDDLKSAFTKIWKEIQDDPAAQNIITEEKDKRKRELQHGTTD